MSMTWSARRNAHRARRAGFPCQAILSVGTVKILSYPSEPGQAEQTLGLSNRVRVSETLYHARRSLFVSELWGSPGGPRRGIGAPGSTQRTRGYGRLSTYYPSSSIFSPAVLVQTTRPQPCVCGIHHCQLLLLEQCI